MKDNCCWLSPCLGRTAARLLLLLASSGLLLICLYSALQLRRPGTRSMLLLRTALPEQEQRTTGDEDREKPVRAPACPPSGHLISAGKCGRLGNIMFEYAVLMGASHSLHRPAWMLPEMSDILSSYFEELSIPVLPRGCRYNWTAVRVEVLLKDKPRGVQDHLIAFYPTAVPVFHPLRKKVLKEFTFRAELRENANHQLATLALQANATSPTFIGVHVRRTDYKKWMVEHTGGRVIGADYLQRALSLIRRRHPEALFVVASDDLAWCRQHLNASDVVLAGDGEQTQPGADLALLAACNHTVLTHGTFGFWAAYLAGGEVVKPTGYGTRHTGVDQNVRRANLNWTWLQAFS